MKNKKRKEERKLKFTLNIIAGFSCSNCFYNEQHPGEWSTEDFKCLHKVRRRSYGGSFPIEDICCFHKSR